MRWKQFLTPVESISSAQGHELTSATSSADLIILDVRQPGEYEAGHLPGAKLIPLPELTDRLGELNPAKTIMVY